MAKFSDIKDIRGKYFVTFKYDYLTRFGRFEGTPAEIRDYIQKVWPGAKNVRFKKALLG